MRYEPCCWAASAAAGIVLWTGAAVATDYQVGPTKTYQSLQDVADLLNPGDVVEIDGDATYPGGVILDRPGTASQKITIRGLRVNGSRPVISGATNTIEVRADHYVLEGLDITAGSFRCFFHHAHDVELRDSVIHDCPQHGLLGADADSGSLLMEYVEVSGSGEGTQHHQIYMATDETAHPGSVFRMQHCYVHDANGGNNVKSRAERNEIYYNWIQGAQYHELELIGPDGQNPSLAREDSDVVGNVLVKDAGTYVVRFGGDGTGETDGRYRFVNNTVLVQSGGSAVFRLFHGLESVEMHNNVFHVIGSGGVNLVRMVEANWTTGSAVIAGSNNWVRSGSTNEPSEWTGTITGDDPGLLDLGSLDLQPAETSPLVDQGTMSPSGAAGHDLPSPLFPPELEPPMHAIELPDDAEARGPVGDIDIGAYEYGTPATGGSGGSGQGGNGQGGSAQGGSDGTGGDGAAATAGAAPAAGDNSDDGGCGCRAAPRPGQTAWLLGLTVAGLLATRRNAR